MKILFDHQIFNWQIYGGISRYHYELLKLLPSYDIDVELTVKYSNNYYLKGDKQFSCRRFLPGLNLRCRNEFIRNSNRKYAQDRLSSQKYDIFHPTSYDDYFLDNDLLQKKPLVLTVHDLIHERFFPNDPSIPGKHRLIARADRVIAISENTKNDILTYVPDTDPNKISVIYHGSDLKKQYPLINNVHLKIADYRYVLFVGSREGYKNFDRFIKAFSLLNAKYKDLSLVCTGKPFTNSEKSIINELGLSKCVISLAVNDVELLYLYHHAEFFVFPSLYEGFGIPILEAFEAGCPIVISKASCFPEIAGDAALYFDPYSVESMFVEMEQALINNDLRNHLISKGYERNNFFSWLKTARQTADLYKSLK